ncbi:MAG: aminotransferase class I/II-fold pyridoxal phosphate-dependent enzyme, partial [Acidobacteriota bacterium]
VREAWRRWQRTEQGDSPVPDEVPSSLPVVTCGLSHGLSLVADLFGGPGRKLALTTPFWGNYRQVFSLRTGVELVTEPAYGTDRRFDPKALRRALGALPEGEPALALANFPSNPGGYAPTAIERARLVEGLVAEAERRPLAVICDDAYGGLAYAEDAPNSSIFWDLAGLHPNLVPIKIDGATKEFGFFGGRVGFLTFGAELEDEARQAIESKIASLVRSTLGSPVATSQMVLLRSLAGGEALAEVSEIRRIARERYGAVRPALEALDPGLLRLLPFNAGFFVLMELADGLGLDPHVVRRHLIEKHDTGVVSSSPNYLRLAICSVAAEDLPETVRRIEQGVRELAGG